jgi:hypothetical protein
MRKHAYRYFPESTAYVVLFRVMFSIDYLNLITILWQYAWNGGNQLWTVNRYTTLQSYSSGN